MKYLFILCLMAFLLFLWTLCCIAFMADEERQ